MIQLTVGHIRGSSFSRKFNNYALNILMFELYRHWNKSDITPKESSGLRTKFYNNQIKFHQNTKQSKLFGTEMLIKKLEE